MLIYIQRLRTADGQPVFLENLFLPYEPYKNLMSENLNDVSMFDAIERISGLRPATTGRQRIEQFAPQQNRHSCSIFRWASRCCI